MIPLTRLDGDHVAGDLDRTNPQIEIAFEQLLAEVEHKSRQHELSRLEMTLGTIKNQRSALESALS